MTSQIRGETRDYRASRGGFASIGSIARGTKWGLIIHTENVEQEGVHVGLFLDDLGGGFAETVPGLCLYPQQDWIVTAAGRLQRRAKFFGVGRYDAIIGIRAEDK